GNAHHFTYDSANRLTQDAGPDGSSKTLARTDNANGFQVNVTTALGNTTTYAVTQLTSGVTQRTVTYPGGLQSVSVIGTDGSTTLTNPDGTVSTIVLGPDPRFGMAAPLTANQTIALPGGLTATTTWSRAVTLSDPTNPLSLTQQTDTLVVNG